MSDFGSTAVVFEKNEDPNVLARAIRKDVEAVILSAPASSINGEDGPVIIPNSESQITIVVSEESLQALYPVEGDGPREVAEKMRLFTGVVGKAVRVGFAYIDATFSSEE